MSLNLDNLCLRLEFLYHLYECVFVLLCFYLHNLPIYHKFSTIKMGYQAQYDCFSEILVNLAIVRALI